MHIFQYSIFQSFLYFIFPYEKKTQQMSRTENQKSWNPGWVEI